MLPQHLPLWIQAGRGRGRGQPDPFTLSRARALASTCVPACPRAGPAGAPSTAGAQIPGPLKRLFQQEGLQEGATTSTHTNSQFSGFTKKSDTSMSSEVVKSMFCPFKIQAFTGRGTLGDPLTRPGLRFSLLENGAVMVPAAQMSLEIP